MGVIHKGKWGEAADLPTRVLKGQAARLDIASLRGGDQIEVEWKPLLAVTYDLKSDMFDLQFDGLSHLILKPREFALREQEGKTDSFLIIDDQGVEHIVQLREPVSLPPTPL